MEMPTRGLQLTLSRPLRLLPAAKAPSDFAVLTAERQPMDFLP
jgi:hypothetical protein